MQIQQFNFRYFVCFICHKTVKEQASSPGHEAASQSIQSEPLKMGDCV